MDTKVQEYIKKQRTPQREIVEKLRGIILKTFPNMKEESKMGVPWYEGKYYLVALKDHVNMVFSIDGYQKTRRNVLTAQEKQ